MRGYGGRCVYSLCATVLLIATLHGVAFAQQRRYDLQRFNQTCEKVPVNVYYPRRRFNSEAQQWSYACVASHNYSQQCPASAALQEEVLKRCVRAVEERVKRIEAMLAQGGQLVVVPTPNADQLWDLKRATDEGLEEITIGADIARLESMKPVDGDALVKRARAEEIKAKQAAVARDEGRRRDEASSQAQAREEELKATRTAAAQDKERRRRAACEANLDLDPEDRNLLAAGAEGTVLSELQNRFEGIVGRTEANSGFPIGVNDYRTGIPKVKRLMVQIQCINPRLAAQWESRADSWLAEAEPAVAQADAAEAKCQADPACLGGRIADDLCPALEEKRDTEAEINETRQRGRRHGVINLSDLNDLSEHVAFLDDRIREMKGRYRGAVGKPFSSRLCRGR